MVKLVTNNEYDNDKMTNYKREKAIHSMYLINMYDFHELLIILN